MSEETQRHRLIAFEAENFKRLKVVKIEPKSRVTELSGKNRQGKSSVLDGVMALFGGRDEIQREPINKNADKAVLRGIVAGPKGDLIIQRTMNAQEDGGFTTALTIRTADGATYGKPQDMLDALVGDISFDLDVFIDAKDPAKIDMLKRLAPGLDFTDLEKANKADFEERRDVNRDAKSVRAQAEAIVLPEDGDFDEVDTAALIAELEQVGTFNTELEQRRAGRVRATSEMESWKVNAEQARKRAEDLRAQATQLDTQAQELETSIVEMTKKLAEAAALPEPKDPAPIREKIANADGQNALARQAAKKFDLVKQADSLDAKSAALTKAMEDRAAEKTKRITEAKLPVEGLSIDDGVVTLAGVPFDQASDAEQLEAAMAIGAALNPGLRLARIRKGAFFDQEAFERLGVLAEQYDMDVWVETVASGRDGALVLEDGAIVGQELEPKIGLRKAPGEEPAREKHAAGVVNLDDVPTIGGAAGDMFGRTAEQADADNEAEPSDMGAN